MKKILIHSAKIATALFSLFLMYVILSAGKHADSTYPFSSNKLTAYMQQAYDYFTQNRPEDRVYLQLDKPMYTPGETIWFSAYLRNGSDLKPSVKSEILHVELINPKGNTQKYLKIVAKDGQAAGDFHLDKSAPGGIYKVKAFTNWQKNDPDPAFFIKEIQVQKVVLPRLKMKLDFERKAFGAGDEVIAKIELNTNENKPLSNFPFRYEAKIENASLIKGNATTNFEGMQYVRFDLPKNLNTNDGLLNIMIDYEGQTESVSRAIPIVLNTIELKLYPEGGDLVEGLKTRVAFSALNEFGKPADVEGIVLDENNKKVADFTSYHQGKGAFDFLPEANHSYKVKITKPIGVKQVYDLPEALPRGFVLNIKKVSEKNATVVINSTETETISLTALVRGNLCYNETHSIKRGRNEFDISTEKFPIGVAQFTLIDSKGIQRAERLAFVNKHKQLNIEIETDKQKYLPREKVKMTIKVTDERGMPMPARLSLAVVDDQLLSFADDKSSTILSHLLLESDIKGKVEEPRFYFDPEEEKAAKALDYLLMTAGWRRFTWKQIKSKDLPQLAHKAEKAIIGGKVLYPDDSKPVKNTEIIFMPGKYRTKTDNEGYFSIENILLDKPYTLKVNDSDDDFYITQTITEYNESMNIVLWDNRTYITGTMDEGLVEDAVMVRDNEDARKRNQFAKGKIVRNMVRRDENKKDEGGGFVEQEREQPGVVDMPEENKQQKNEKYENGDVIMSKIVATEEEVINIGEDGAVYYRAREFDAPDYENKQQVEMRTDFRSTIYWNPTVEIDRSGKTTVEFYNSDAITSFRTIVEGIAEDGSVGRAEATHFTQLPVAMSVKLPVEVATEDKLYIPLTLKNNTKQNLRGKLTIEAPQSLKPISRIDHNQKLEAGETKTLFLGYEVLSQTGTDKFRVTFESKGFRDAFEQEITTAPKGYPIEISFSGNEKEKEYLVEIKNIVDGSMKTTFTAYPSVINDLLAGVESILREPYGCFEQTSTSSYPNVLALRYMKEQEETDPAVLAKATDLLDRGYKRLTTFETSEKGYEWFGGAPGHEALTAYGLMQFNEMKEVYPDIDEKMIERTADWLMKRKDGKGGFKRNDRALDTYGRADEDITNAYIVYALSEAGYRNIEKELEAAYSNAVKADDPYQMALVCNAMYNTGDKKRGNELLSKLSKKQSENGFWEGNKHSITYSTGKSLKVETTSLVILAIIKSPSANMKSLNSAVKFIVSSRSGYGGFGSTQATILALKSLTEFAKFSKKTDEDGTIELFVDGKKVATKHYEAGEKNPIEIRDFEKYLTHGKHKIKVRYINVKNPLPYSIGISYSTFLPNSSADCKLELSTKLDGKRAKTGETMRLSIELDNKTNDGLPMTMAIVGIPGGLTAQPWQLKELQEKKAFDYYEVRNNRLFFYYRQMKPSEKRTINLDLKAELPGRFEAPASCAYLYYTAEHKHWTKTDIIDVKQ